MQWTDLPGLKLPGQVCSGLLFRHCRSSWGQGSGCPWAGYGIDLYIYGDNNSYIRYSKYVTNYTSTSNCEDVFDILKSKRSNSEKPIVISCCDEVAHCFDIYYDEFKDYYHLL